MPIPRDIVDKTLATAHGSRAYGVVEKLTDAGCDTWWVGGCIRDMLQGRIPQDIDIATAATPEMVQKTFPKHDASAAELGSLIVTERSFPFEVTTFREDDEVSDGRHPESVVFGTREQDAVRRDITVNALYWHPISRMLFDPFNGEGDLRERLIRFIGDPGVRIKHDALRLLRVVRFRALLDGQYHPETYQALMEGAPLAEHLSGSRQYREIEKMLLGPRPERAFEDLWEMRILQYIIPELYACKGIAQPADYHHEGDVWDHTMMILKSFIEEHDLDVRLAALFHDIGKAKTFDLKERIRFDAHAPISAEIAAAVLERLQCHAKQRNKIAWLIEHHMMMTNFFSMPDERKAHWYFHPWFHELLQLFWLDIAGTEPSDYTLYGRIVQDYHTFLDRNPRPPKQLISGDEVMELLGIDPGERVGEVLKALHDAQVRGEVTRKAEAREFVKRMSRSGV
ncbi:MAG: CCA tRNA nucleotidyltransferase [Candidatus Peribacteraceae bacterium]|nr:CCA tRNA nucleotidyltransferase [Candidatus Peribacteraceae bacterium]